MALNCSLYDSTKKTVTLWWPEEVGKPIKSIAKDLNVYFVNYSRAKFYRTPFASKWSFTSAMEIYLPIFSYGERLFFRC